MTDYLNNEVVPGTETPVVPAPLPEVTDPVQPTAPEVVQ